ncbi:uncharacterized protein EV154DRAFT_521619, partial [Mucor mucedo]|uniref:uncharacterized protein n=1 Tax=Mucor mucedo TaxID=29922 RepID=UPI00221EE248
MSSSSSSDKNIFEYPTHIIQEIIKEIKRKLTVTEQKTLEEFITTRGIIIDNKHKHTNYSKTDKLTIYKGIHTVLKQFKDYKIQNQKPINEDIEMENTNQPPKTYAEGDIMQLLTALLQQQQLQQPSQQSDNGHVKIPTPPLYDGTRDVTKIDNWYTSVEHYLNFNNFDKSRWVTYAISLLTDHARLWYYRVKKTYDLTTWEMFKA